MNKDMAYQNDLSGESLDLRISELTEIDLMDVYEGEKIPAGKVSLTLRLNFPGSRKNPYS